MSSFISQSWRSWKNAKPVALLSIVALAFGTGSTIAIYTVVNTVMLKPLMYQHGERFVALFSARVNDPISYGANSLADLQVYQQQTVSFDVFGWFKFTAFNLTSPGEPQHVNATAVTPELARSVGVQPILGQWFQDDSGAVISHSLWLRLNSDRNIVGKAMTLSGRTYTVTGVMPAGFRLPITGVDFQEVHSDVWIGLDPAGRGQDRAESLFIAYARMKP